VIMKCMFRLLLLPALMCGFLFSAAWPEQPEASMIVRGPNQLRYHLNLDYTKPHVLNGTESISFNNPLRKPLTMVWLRLWANGLSGCHNRMIQVRVLSGASSSALATGCSALRLKLTHAVSPGARDLIRLQIKLRTPNREDRFGRLHGVDILGYAFPVMAVHDERGWHYREHYTNLGESFYSLAGNWRVRVVTPRFFSLAGTGSAVSASPIRRGHRTWNFVAPHARDFLLFGGKMKMISTWQDGVHIRLWGAPSYFRPGAIDPALYPDGSPRSMLRWAKLSVKMFNRWFGHYNRPELDLFVDTQAGGMEFPDAVTSVPWSEVLVHEIAHQWWYSMLGNDQHRSPWLDESFAEYSTMRIIRFANDKYVLACTPGWLEEWNKTKLSLSANMGVWDSRMDGMDYTRGVYCWGAVRLNELAIQMGPARADYLFHDLFQRYRDRIITTNDVLDTMRHWAPPGFDLDRWIRESRIQPSS